MKRILKNKLSIGLMVIAAIVGSIAFDGIEWGIAFLIAFLNVWAGLAWRDD